MEKESSRIVEFDFLRAIAIMYIVGVHHIDDYASGFFHCKVDDILTYSFLGLFIFISGFLLNTNNKIESVTDLILFFKKRFFRIYPLYIVALYFFYLEELISYKGFLLGSFLLNTIVVHSIPTLWFVSVICVYYLLFSFLVWNYTISKMLIMSSLVMILLITINIQSSLIDYRLIIFFPAFVGGIYFSKFSEPIKKMTDKLLLNISTIIFLISSLSFFVFESNSIRFIFLGVFLSTSIPIIFYFTMKINRIVNADIFKKIAYASFSIYLFHRVIFYLAIDLYKPVNDILTLIYLYIFAMPIIYFLSYFIQLCYDKLLGILFSGKIICTR